MTFSIVARDDTGALGIALTSSSPAVAARCIHLRSGVGGVASQNITDPRYGRILLDAAQAGQTPDAAMADLVAHDATAAYRQILFVDAEGRVAAHAGARMLGRNRTVCGDGVAVGGNLLADESVPDAMLAAYEAQGGDLEYRLLAALRAGLDAGGEAGDIHSCGLAVTRTSGWNETDLRVDWADADPLADLAALLDRWMPQRDDYVTRGIHPDTAPAYGVPGDE